MDNTRPQTIIIDENDFIHRVYSWMAVGLLITAVTGFFVSTSDTLVNLFVNNAILFYGILILELVAVIFLSAAIKKMSSSTAGIVFILYAILNGLTFSLIFLVYTATSIGAVFAVCAGMFAVLSAYGFMTKKDLTTVGHIAFMALIGLILASIINIFIVSDGFSLVISYIGVIIFAALTAYDTQKIKAMNMSLAIGSEEEKKAAVMGALRLYLDFINLFLDLLRIGGRRR